MNDLINILIVEDNIDDFELCERALHKAAKYSYQLTHLNSGLDVMQTLQTHATDCILLDYSLPGLSCIELIQTILEFNPDLPIVILTGQGSEAIAVNLMRTGAVDYITKDNINPDFLSLVIEEAISKANEEKNNKQTSNEIDVLIIDDNPDDCELCIRALRKNVDKNYRARESHSVTEAFHLLQQPDYQPDCILLDYSLPGSTGLDALTHLNDEYPFLPVIMMTGQGNENIAVQAMKLGAQNYLVKSNINDISLNNAVLGAIKNSRMNRQLAEKEAALLQSQKRLKEALNFQKLILSNIPDMVYVKDSDLKIIQANPAFLKMFSPANDNEVIGSSGYEALEKGDKEALLEIARLALDVGHAESEMSLTFPDATKRIIHSRKVRFEGVDGRPYLLALVRDITDKKHAEEKILQSNIELQRFAYVASHDLQEPLRMVTQFTDLLREKYASQLDDTAQNMIQYAFNGARRMQHLVDDLLMYARLDNEVENNIEVDTNTIMATVEENLYESIHQSQAKITYKDLPTISTNPLRFCSVMQNLISNAIKYQDANSQPVIHITCDWQDNFWQFQITDNGIGMKPEYCKKIFEPFKRLHPQAKYSGTGIGLAICRKVIERFGGEIWAESNENSGSSFYFTIPASDNYHSISD